MPEFKILYSQKFLNSGIGIGQTKDQQKPFYDLSKKCGPTVGIYDDLIWYKKKF